MGTDKALLALDGHRLVDHMVDRLTQALVLAGEQRVVVRINGAPGGRTALMDLRPGLGPLGGVEAAIREYPGSLLVFLPVDMPSMSPELLSRLIRESKGKMAASFRNQEMPFALHSNGESARLLERLCGSMDQPRSRSVRSLLRELDAAELPWDSADARCFLNLNTSREWNSWLREAGHESALVSV